MRHYDAYKYSQSEMTAAWDLMADKLKDRGALLLTETRATGVSELSGGFAITATSGGTEVEIISRAVILASGRLGGDLVGNLDLDGLNVSAPQFVDVGVRLEFPKCAWGEMDQAHNDLKLHFGDARTFCASKGGWITPYFHHDIMLLEGRTDLQAQSHLSNIAITVRTELNASALFSHVRGRILAHGPGAPLRQRLHDYLAEKSERPRNRDPHASFSYWRWGDVNHVFPSDVANKIRSAVRFFCDRVLPASAHPDTAVFAPEMDYFWPEVRVQRGFVARNGVWAIGDLTGEFRGIGQAFCSGREIASDVHRYLGHR